MNSNTINSSIDKYGRAKAKRQIKNLQREESVGLGVKNQKMTNKRGNYYVTGMVKED